MAVPMIEFKRQLAPLKAECMAVFERVYDSTGFIGGPEVTGLEGELAAYTGAAQGIAVSSGTDALVLALMALDVGAGDEVLCPAFTFFATAGSISRLGATPVWVDSELDTYNIDLADAARKISGKTKVIIPVHLFGQSANMAGVKALAEAHGLKVLEDAAQSLGACYGDEKAGAIGDFGAYSFYPTKNLGGYGEGGALVTSDPELGEKAIWLRNHGMNPRYYHKFVGGNFRLDAIQAGLLRVKLPHLEGYHAARRANAARYLEAFEGIDGLILPREVEGNFHVWNQFTVRVTGGKREAFRAHLAEKGIGNDVYYPVTLDAQECFAGVGRGHESLSGAHQLAKEVVSLPIFPELSEEEREEVIAAVETFWKG